MGQSIKERVDFFCPGNVPSSKNGRVGTGKYFVVSKATRTGRDATKQWWKDNKEPFIEATKDKDRPLIIGMHFVRKQKRLYDWVNPIQTIQDEMVKQGWIEDDDVDNMFPLPFPIDDSLTTHDKDEPGVGLIIFNKMQIDYEEKTMNIS